MNDDLLVMMQQIFLPNANFVVKSEENVVGYSYNPHYSVTSQLPLSFDRLVCVVGGVSHKSV